jgi:hypothetical protein
MDPETFELWAAPPSTRGRFHAAAPTGTDATPAPPPGLSSRAPVCTAPAAPWGYEYVAFRPWSDCDVAAYRRWVQDHAGDYVNRKDFERDCADWLLFVLIRFAREHGLPVGFAQGTFDLPLLGAHLRTLSTRHLSPTDPAHYDALEDAVRRPIGAQDLHDVTTENTVEVAMIDELLPGDLLTQTHHVQLVVNNPALIDAPDKSGVVKPRRALEIARGNLVQAAGTKIEHRAWDLESANYYEEVGGGWRFLREDAVAFGKQWNTPAGFCGRRWNFRFFDRFIPLRKGREFINPFDLG